MQLAFSVKFCYIDNKSVMIHFGGIIVLRRQQQSLLSESEFTMTIYACRHVAAQACGVQTPDMVTVYNYVFSIWIFLYVGIF